MAVGREFHHELFAYKTGTAANYYTHDLSPWQPPDLSHVWILETTDVSMSSEQLDRFTRLLGVWVHN
jgi:hypothetical protein